VFGIVLLFAASSFAGESRIADVAERGDWKSLQLLIDSKSDPNSAQLDGTTALHWAAFRDDVAIVKQLLTAGADSNAKNRYGVTPLSQACVNGNAEIIRALLAAHADPNAPLPGGETPLMTASRTGKADAVKALIEAGATVDAKDRKGQTALMWAADENNAAAMQALIDAGADIHARLKSGFTPMLFAAREGKIDAVRVLLKAGVDPNEVLVTDIKGGGLLPKPGDSALILAVENGHFELAMELVKAGANPNDQRSGFTPLHTLTWVRKPNRGDDPDGQPPPEGTGNLTSMQFARELVAHGADVNARLVKGASGRGKLGMTGATAFLLASKTADLSLMKLLIELGADPLLPNKDGCTPLMAAAGIGTLAPDEEAGTEEECLAAVEFLLQHGADVNTVDKNGETAMHGAAYKSLPRMVQLLADKGAKIDIWNRKDKYGWTPLLLAQGFRPGNFKPSFETIDAIEKVMRTNGATPPPAPNRNPTRPGGYDDGK
jgi:ankyrin repeat protein